MLSNCAAWCGKDSTSIINYHNRLDATSHLQIDPVTSTGGLIKLSDYTEAEGGVAKWKCRDTNWILDKFVLHTYTGL